MKIKKKMKINLVLGAALFTVFAALPAFADGACGNRCVDDACAEQVVALTYPEPYNGEERVAQRATIDVAPPKPAPRPPRWVPVRPGPPRPVGPPPRPVPPPPRPRWIWW